MDQESLAVETETIQAKSEPLFHTAQVRRKF